MSRELCRRHCPHCGRDVDAVRSMSNDLFWFLIFGWLAFIWDVPRPWYCRECGRRIPESEARERRRSVYNWLVAVFLALVAVVAALAILGSSAKR